MEGPSGMPPAAAASGRKALLASHATPWAQSPTAQEAPTSASPQTGPAQSAEAARSLTSPPPTPAPRPRATPSLAAASIRRSTASAPATPSASRSATFSPDQKPRERDGRDAPIWDDAPRKVAQGRNGKRRTEKHRRPTPNQLHESLPPTVTRTPCRPAAAARWKKATRRQKTVPRGPDTQHRRIRPPLQAGTGRLRHKSLHGWRQGRRAPRHSREEAVRGAARNPSALRKRKAMPQTAGIPRRAEARTASPLAKYAEGDLFNMCDLEL